MRAEYDILLVADNLVNISDRGTGGRSIAKDARLVAERLAMDVGRLTRRRKVSSKILMAVSERSYLDSMCLWV